MRNLLTLHFYILLCLKHIPISAKQQIRKTADLVPPALMNPELKEPGLAPRPPQDDANITEPKINEEHTWKLEQ